MLHQPNVIRVAYSAIITILLGVSVPALAQASSGVFKVVKGDVTVAAKDGKFEKAKIGQKVLTGYKIRAGKDSRAKLVMVDGNEINISPDSEFLIESYQYKPAEGQKNVLLNVISGKVRAKVNQKYEGENKFQVKTKSAVAGVRGTDFFTSYNPSNNATRVVTFEGRVEFGLPGANGAIINPVMVGVGQTTSIVGDTPPPPPVEVSKSELAAIDTTSDAETAPPGSEPREPASGPAPNQPAAPQEQPKDQPSDSATSSSAPSSSGAAPVAESNAPAPREPASVPAGATTPTLGGPTVKPADLPSQGEVIFVPPPLPPTIPAPAIVPPPIVECTVCRDIIESQNRVLKVIVTPGD